MSDHFQKAMGYLQAGQHQSALKEFEAIVNQGDSSLHAQAHWMMGRTLFQLGDRARGIAQLQRATDLRPDHVDSLGDLAECCVHDGQLERALEISTRAVAEHPDHWRLSLIRGTCLELLSDFEGALACLETANTQSPGVPIIQIPLMRAYRRNGLLEQALEVADAAIRAGRSNKVELARIWNEIGHVRDQRSEYDQAFAAFSESGQWMLKSVPGQSIDSRVRDHEIEDYRQWLECQPDPPGGNHVGAAERRLAFLIGFPRSGTTLTEQILAAHSRVTTSQEHPFLDTVIRLIKQQVPGGRLSLALQPGNARLLETCRQAYWESVRKKFPDADLFVDKLPLNMIHGCLLQAIFPDARFILCVRDPRDVCLSCFFQMFILTPAMKKFLDWETTAAFYRAVMDLWELIHPRLEDNLIEVRYEDTVADVRSQAQRMARFLNLELEESMVDFHQSSSRTVIATPSYEAVRRPINQKSRGRWKNYPDAIEQVTEHLRPVAERLRYVW